MFMSIEDALLPTLITLAIGLLAGAVLSNAWRQWQQRRQAAAAHAAALRQMQKRRAVTTKVTRVENVRRSPRDPVMANPLASLVLPEAADLLLVDDSAVARAKLRRLFEPAGYIVHLANDGVEALALLKKGRYAMMITDLEMPNMDGIELINTCLGQPHTARMPILAITGHDHLRAKFNQCRDIAGIHRKPWVDDILLSHVAALIGTRQARVTALMD